LPNALKEKASAISRPEIKRPSRWGAKVSAHTYIPASTDFIHGKGKNPASGDIKKNNAYSHFQKKNDLVVLSKYNTRQGKTDKTP
jgi:hypothetical protein